jgi:cellulose synthase/poly-beta-1,6-N-acetylglucosamine synthase-like glycosyltransferase
MQKFINKLIVKYGKKVLIGSLIFLFVGLICLILGFGFGKGWDYLARWFTMSYAYILYIGLLIYGCCVGVGVHIYKVQTEMKGVDKYVK